MTVYKFYVSSVATADGVAQLDIRQDGQIVGINFGHRVTCPAGGICSQMLEVSFSSSSAFTTNDTQSSIATTAVGETAAGANAQFGKTHFVSFAAAPIRVEGGERLFVHSLVGTAPASANHTIHVYVDDKSGGPKGRRAL